MLGVIPDCWKDQRRSNKAVSTYPPAVEFIPEYYKSQEAVDKAVIKLLIFVLLYLILFLIDI